jgi:PBP1b-binding outer membrane lipoprotein LpoB
MINVKYIIIVTSLFFIGGCNKKETKLEHSGTPSKPTELNSKQDLDINLRCI